MESRLSERDRADIERSASEAAKVPAKVDVSDYEHPLTREELATMIEPFHVEGTRYFRLPFVPLISGAIPSQGQIEWKVSNSIIKRWAGAERYATGVVAKLQKMG